MFFKICGIKITFKHENCFKTYILWCKIYLNLSFFFGINILLYNFV